MTTVTLNKWGNSTGIRIPKTILDTLEFKQGEQLDMNVSGNEVILKKHVKQSQVTIEELFHEYNGDIFQAQPFVFEQTGNEKW
ncbi:AbrB/MazE/SpoVT family DNA-binding domain-containing protein [Lactococcus insecticola]|uniref:Cell division protein FtsW n=1 Tax=Pseudolactococcus insecticola TaxID=2709158 RepID=A0A6A0BBU1_9LACT|nr:AbrB/MazE/SpoVT family DNA-binding domain-containing protein [Lactococcus insecticola]GFH41297.1 cell division protein FtsW [Lactococcus insecticola]